MDNDTCNTETLMVGECTVVFNFADYSNPKALEAVRRILMQAILNELEQENR